jgi:nitroreductase
MDQVIKARKTEKVLSATPWPVEMSEAQQRELAAELLELAGAAPYHYESAAKHRGELDSSLPFRYYVLSAEKCRETAAEAIKQGVEAGKMGEMLHTADLMFVVTFTPDLFGDQDDSREPIPFTGNLRNMEHIAAASASIQNVLLGATSRGLPNYWSSGGVLRFDPMRSYLGIPMSEVLLGGLMIFPKDGADRADMVAKGSLREKGKAIESWSKWV